MPKAARIDDTIAHTGAFTGMLTGLILGAAVGALIVATGGAGVLLIAGAAATGATIGKSVGKLFTSNEGVIVTGADTVRIGRRRAARAVDDLVNCHPGKKIAQGSRTVIIEDFPASRIGDKTECDGTISSGSANVDIGREPGTYVKIGSEIPIWLEFLVEVLDLLGGMKGKGKGKPKPKKKKPKTKKRKTKNKKNKPKKKKPKKTKPKKKKPKAKKRKPKKTKPKKTRKKPQKKKQPKKKKPGKSSKAPKKNKKREKDPIDVASGAVVESSDDFELGGLIPVRWTRHYSSDAEPVESPLGIAGWTHDLDQWIEVDVEDDVLSMRAEEGRDIYFDRIAIGASTFHRGEALTLTASDDGVYQVFDHQERFTRHYSQLEPGGRAYLRRIEDAHGNRVAFYYGSSGLERIVDTCGREINISSDERGRIIRVEVRHDEEVLQFVEYRYHVTGELAAVTDALGGVESYEYDNQHCIIQKTLPNGLSAHYVYDEEDGRCVSGWVDGELHAAEFEYDDEECTTTVHADVESRFYEWNEDGAVIRQATFEGDDLALVEFDEDGLILVEGPTDEALTRHEYDARGNRIKTFDPAGNVTEWTYGNDDLPIARKDPDGLLTQFKHDERGNLIWIRYPNGSEVALSYDSHGRMCSLRQGDITLLETTFDAQHNVKYERDARGGSTQYEHDAMGRPIASTDALGRTTRVEYDVLGRVVRHIAADGTTSDFEYDALGNLTKSTDAVGGTSHLEYAGTGVLSKLIGPDGEAWLVNYDDDERITEIVNPARECHSFEYDEAGRIIGEETFDRRRLAYRYDDEGLLDSIDYPDGTFRSFQYDVLGNVIKEVARHTTIEFDRDELGRVERAEVRERSGKIVTEVERDALGQVVVEKQNEHAIRYEYDAQGQRIARHLPNGSTTRYAYDALGELIAIDHDGRKLEIERDKLGRETSRRMRDGSFLQNDKYDDMDRLVERHVLGGRAHQALSSRTWRYDKLGRPVEITDDRWGATVYQYDRVGQLIEARRGAGREVFQYDVAGSLRSILNDLGKTGRTWHTEPGNLLKETEDTRFEYDKRGRRTKKLALVASGEGALRQRPGDVTEYQWDERDLLREVKLPSGDRVAFAYDAFGRRVRKEILPNEGGGAHRIVEFLWDGDELAADIDNRRGTRVFVHEPGTFVPVLQAEQGEVFAVVNDHLGTPKELIDAQGRVAWSAAHSAWGKVIEEYHDGTTRRQRAVESPFRLLGQYADEETGLCHTKFRYFDADTGRWCSPDPLGIEGGLNLHAFDDSPSVAVDPLGLCTSQKGKSRKRGKDHGNHNDNGKPNHAYVIVDTKTGKLMKPGISGSQLTKSGQSPRANQQLRELNRNNPGRYKAVVVEKDVSRRRAKEIEQMITDKHGARNGGDTPPLHQRPKPRVETREGYIDKYGKPDNRRGGKNY